jgi:hypothetical protein
MKIIVSKDQLWREIVLQNPQITTTGIELSPAGAEKFFNLVWDHAHDHGEHKQWKSSQQHTESFSSIFSKIMHH